MPRAKISRTGEFIGQKRVVKRLLEQQVGASYLDPPQPMPHVLLVGIPGIGKSLLARTLAQNAGSNVVSFYAEEGDGELEKRLLSLEPHDYLACDEAHVLTPKQQYCFLDVLTESTCRPDAAPPNNAPRDDSGRIKIHPCTIIFATNYPEKLINDLLGRIEITEELTYYTVAELREITRTYVSDCGMLIKPQALTLLAKAASGIPREAKHLVRRLQRHLVCQAVKINRPGPSVVHVDSAQVRRFFRQQGIHLVQDHHDARLWCGLKPSELRYLKFLTKHNYTSMSDMTKLTGISAKRLEQHVERTLIRCGLLEIQSRGRTLTPEGRNWIRKVTDNKKELVKEAAA